MADMECFQYSPVQDEEVLKPCDCLHHVSPPISQRVVEVKDHQYMGLPAHGILSGSAIPSSSRE